MSTVISVCGSACSSSYVSVTGCSTSPKTLKSHVARSVCGTAPACSPGHFSVRYCPGGRRAGSSPFSTSFCSALDRKRATRTYTSCHAQHQVSSPRVHPRLRAGRGGLPPADGVERRRRARHRRRMRGAAAAADDFLLLTEPELGEPVRSQLLRARFAAKAEIEPEQHESWLVLGGEEVLDERPSGDDASEEEYERWRIEGRVPRWGRELDDSVLPAEAGLEKTHIDFSKGCYPGQEPIARQHYRGKVNRRLRVLDVEGEVEPGDELVFNDKKVGRITSAVDGVALGYVRTEVP